MQFMTRHWHSVLQVLDSLEIWHPIYQAWFSLSASLCFWLKSVNSFKVNMIFFPFYQKGFDFLYFQFQIMWTFFFFYKLLLVYQIDLKSYFI